jgi:hypothetical protein
MIAPVLPQGRGHDQHEEQGFGQAERSELPIPRAASERVRIAERRYG